MSIHTSRSNEQVQRRGRNTKHICFFHSFYHTTVYQRMSTSFSFFSYYLSSFFSSQAAEVSLLQAKKAAVACEVRTAKELSDTSRHCSLKQQMLILELFHSSLSNTNKRSKSRSKSKSRSDSKSKDHGEAGLSLVDSVDETDSGGEEVVSSHEPSPLAQLSSVVIDSKIKVCVYLIAMLIAPHCMLIFYATLSLLSLRSNLLTILYILVCRQHVLLLIRSPGP